MKLNARVCMISCTHPLYDDRIYWKEALSLKKRGYDVYHIGVGHENKEYISEHGIKLILVCRKNYSDNPVIDKLYHNFIPGKNVYKEILEIAAGLKADVYHLHDLQINRIGKQLKSLSHNPKVIYDVHEPFPVSIRYSYSANIFEKIIRLLYSIYIHHWELKCSKLYDFILTTEENVWRKFKKIVGNNKADIIYNYTDLNIKYENIPFTNREYDAIYCGGITAIRGIYQIIRIAGIAKMKSRNLKFLILGRILDRNLKPKIIALIKKYGLSENVILKDRIPYSEVPIFYNKSKIGLALFLDNPINHIILPIKIFEYMAFGLPVVCSNLGYLFNYTTNNNTGIAVNPQKPAEIYNAIVNILDNKSVYEEYKNNCLKASNEKYDWSLMELKLNYIYSRILNQKESDND